LEILGGKTLTWERNLAFLKGIRKLGQPKEPKGRKLEGQDWALGEAFFWEGFSTGKGLSFPLGEKLGAPFNWSYRLNSWGKFGAPKADFLCKPPSWA